jgi:O-acetyl-ADP-ribose deacetylase (regulator of RNase III)
MNQEKLQNDLSRYRQAINLDEPFNPSPTDSLNDSKKETYLTQLIMHLADESGIKVTTLEEMTAKDKRQVLQEMITIRSPGQLPVWFMDGINLILQQEKGKRGIISLKSLTQGTQCIGGSGVGGPAKMVLWQGDITRLQVDCIVNAANSQLLGCFQPFHACIDNVVQNAAGPQVREDCQTIIKLQNEPERTGWAKITRAYNLPSRYMIHTVGPIINRSSKNVTANDEKSLKSSYFSCLEMTRLVEDIRSIAFCCISTGVFGYPQKAAAQIAIRTVTEWLEIHPDSLDCVVFNVFKDSDQIIYSNILSQVNE